MTERELDALVMRAHRYTYKSGHDEALSVLDLADAITTLRAQLAAETARAERAEAFRAAQIELSARLLDDWAANLRDLKIYGTPAIIETCAGMIRAQPHPSTALDAAIRVAKEEALRKAETATLGLATGRECQLAIRALIEREATP